MHILRRIQALFAARMPPMHWRGASFNPPIPKVPGGPAGWHRLARRRAQGATVITNPAGYAGGTGALCRRPRHASPARPGRRWDHQGVAKPLARGSDPMFELAPLACAVLALACLMLLYYLGG